MNRAAHQPFVAPTNARPNGALHHKTPGQRPPPITKPLQPAKLGSDPFRLVYDQP